MLIFDFARIETAITKAIVANKKTVDEKKVKEITENITSEILDRFLEFYPNVENIQDIVEKHLMLNDMPEPAAGTLRKYL